MSVGDVFLGGAGEELREGGDLLLSRPGYHPLDHAVILVHGQPTLAHEKRAEITQHSPGRIHCMVRILVAVFGLI